MRFRSRRKRLLPLAERIARLKKHFAGEEHFAGPKYPPALFDFRDHWDLQRAVITCLWEQRLSVQETAEVLGLSEDEVDFAVDCIIQNAQ